MIVFFIGIVSLELDITYPDVSDSELLACHLIDEEGLRLLRCPNASYHVCVFKCVTGSGDRKSVV